MSSKIGSSVDKRFHYGAPYTNTSINRLSPKYFCIFSILCTNDEFASYKLGGRSWSDFHRSLGGAECVTTLLNALIQCFDSKESEGIADIDTYFIRDPAFGHVFLICLRKQETFTTWTEHLYRMMRGKQATTNKAFGGKAPLRSMGDVGDMDLASNLVRTINGTIHPTLANQITLKTHIPYSFSSLTESNDAAVAYIAAISPALDTPEAADFFAHIDAAFIYSDQYLSDQSLINPFLALNVHRILRYELLSQISPATEYIAADLANSIFSHSGALDFGRLPDHVVAYRISFCETSAAWFFPDCLPSMTVMRAALASINPLYRVAFSTMSDPDLAEAILRQVEIPDTNPPLFFVNPLNSGGMYTEEIPAIAYNMPYLKEFAAMVQHAKQRRLPFLEMRAVLIDIVARTLNTLSEDTTSTPDGPKSAAKQVLEGGTMVGLHHLPIEQRPSQTGAWIAWSLDWFEKLGATVHHTFMGLTNNMAILTTYSSDNGGVQLAHAGFLFIL